MQVQDPAADQSGRLAPHCCIEAIAFFLILIHTKKVKKIKAII